EAGFNSNDMRNENLRDSDAADSIESILQDGKSGKNKFSGEDGIFISNAGLILLHPFLNNFFAENNLTENGKFKNENSKTIAAHLLHFLATKKISPPEHVMTLEKFLCGIEIEK